MRDCCEAERGAEQERGQGRGDSEHEHTEGGMEHGMAREEKAEQK